MNSSNFYIKINYKFNFKTWDKPAGETIPRDKQHRLLSELRDWLKKKRIKTDITLPNIGNNSKQTCSWAGCNKPALKNMMICAEHFDENILTK